MRDGTTDRGAQAARVWDGVVWSRLGRGDLAWASWDLVDDVELAPWVDAERGRALRELGLHGRAERHDLDGLRRATDPIDETALWIGLTADAVGVGDADTATIRLAAAADALESAPAGPRRDRQRLRLTWVEAEVAALTDDPSMASSVADGPWPWVEGDRLRFPPVFDAGTVFHRAKGALFRGTLDADRTMLRAGLVLAPPVLTWAFHLALADLGEPGAVGRARTAWRDVTPPPHVADAVAAGPVARRLRAGTDAP